MNFKVHSEPEEEVRDYHCVHRVCILGSEWHIPGRYSSVGRRWFSRFDVVEGCWGASSQVPSAIEPWFHALPSISPLLDSQVTLEIPHGGGWYSVHAR